MLKHLKEWVIVLAIIIGTIFIVSIGLKMLFTILTSEFFIVIIIAELIMLGVLAILYRIQK